LPWADDHHRPLYRAAQKQIRDHIAERTKRIGKIIDKLPRSIEKALRSGNEDLRRFVPDHRALLERREAILGALGAAPQASGPPELFLAAYERGRAASDHLQAVRNVEEPAAEAAAEWLVRTAELAVQRAAVLLP
jgi:hypothetical protein